MEHLVEWELEGETKVYGGNLPQCCFVHHKSHMTWPWIASGPPLCEAGDQSPELWHGREKRSGQCNKKNNIKFRRRLYCTYIYTNNVTRCSKTIFCSMELMSLRTLHTLLLSATFERQHLFSKQKKTDYNYNYRHTSVGSGKGSKSSLGFFAKKSKL
jgi:hypothetical protein